MDIRFTGKNLDVTDGMKEHLEERILKLERYAPRIVEAHIVVEKEKYLYEAEVTLLAKNLRAYGEAQSKENIFVAIDQACARVEKQLKKFREKVKDHHKYDVEYVLLSEDEAVEAERAFEQLDRSKRQILQSESEALMTLTPAEASEELEKSTDHFLLFLNKETNKVNIIFKRSDGHHGIREPKF